MRASTGPPSPGPTGPSQTDASRPIGFALVGCGAAGLLQAKVISADPDLDLVVLVDTEMTAAARVADAVQQLGGHYPLVSTNLDWALALESVDIVAVCLPSGLHVAVAALQAGKRVVVGRPGDRAAQAALRLRSASRATYESVAAGIRQRRHDVYEAARPGLAAALSEMLSP